MWNKSSVRIHLVAKGRTELQIPKRPVNWWDYRLAAPLPEHRWVQTPLKLSACNTPAPPKLSSLPCLLHSPHRTHSKVWTCSWCDPLETMTTWTPGKFLSFFLNCPKTHRKGQEPAMCFLPKSTSLHLWCRYNVDCFSVGFGYSLQAGIVAHRTVRSLLLCMTEKANVRSILLNYKSKQVRWQILVTRTWCKQLKVPRKAINFDGNWEKKINSE